MRKRKKIIEKIDTGETVRLEKVTKSYGISTISSFPAVNRISLSIFPGEFVAITGTSGSGKSTLMHMIGGIEKPTNGKVFICGQNIYDMDDKELSDFRCRNIGTVYQFFNLIPVLNVEENIAFPIIVAGKRPDFNEITELINELNLENKGDCLPNQLSGGQQQRVAIGRAIISSPSLILADEPTGNLDSENSKEVIDTLENLCRKHKKTLIIITHDEKIALRADRVIRIEDGRIFSDKKRGDTL